MTVSGSTVRALSLALGSSSAAKEIVDILDSVDAPVEAPEPVATPVVYEDD